MSWNQGNNPSSFEDVNGEMLALQGDLTDEQAQATLGKFLFHNPGLLLSLFCDIEIYAFQEIMLRGWLWNDYNLAVLCRGASKSYSCAIICILWALMNPNTRIIILSFSFRSSRSILEQIEKFVTSKNAPILKNCFPDKLSKKTDEWVWKLPNGATIKCLPLGDGSNLRGQRADFLCIDERNFISEQVIKEVILPFLASNSNVKEYLKTKEIEDEKIKRGEIKEEDRTILKESVKVLHLSSAGYKFEDMYKQYEDWINKINDEKRNDGISYFVARVGWEALPSNLLNEKNVKEAKDTMSEVLFNKEYGAIFASDSGGYFKISKMHECTVKDGDSPTLELYGDKKSEYVVAIDVALSGAEDADYFAIVVSKIIKREDGKKIPLIIHSYAVAGGDLKEHILYFYYILKNFNVVYIAIDASQGDNVEFLNSAVQSKLFQDAHIHLEDIDCDFKKDNFNDHPAEIKKSYSLTTGKIVQKQPFLSPWQRAANEYLQAAFDHKWVLFGSKICGSPEATRKYMNMDISILKGHKFFEDMSALDCMEQQDAWINMTKTECALIEVSTTELGTMQWRLPRSLRQTTGPNRVRKDLYSALLLNVWASKLFIESQGVEIQTGPQDFPYFGF